MLSAILSDQPDDVLADLKRQLEKRIAEARDTIAQSESELRLVEQAIAARGPRATGGASAVDAERERKADGRFEGIPRHRILAVASALHEQITPARVVEAFAERGETVNVEQIRIALSRIAKDGNLTKIGPSLYAVPGTQLADPDASQPQEAAMRQAPESETGTTRDPFRRGVLGAAFNRNAFRRTS